MYSVATLVFGQTARMAFMCARPLHALGRHRRMVLVVAAFLTRLTRLARQSGRPASGRDGNGQEPVTG